MLSHESEKFIKEFRIELFTRGKDETMIAELEEELRDHLIEAEADGKTLDDVTNGSVENYINRISKEVPFEDKIGRVVWQAAFGLVLLITIPELINGTFDFTVSHMLYLILFLVLGPLAVISFIKHLFVEHVDMKNEKIEKMGYVKIIIASIFFMGILVGGILLHRTFPIYEFLSLDISTTRIIGYVLFSVAVVIFVSMKQWILLGTFVVVTLPNIIAQVFTSGNPEDTNYIMITVIGLFVLWLLFMIVSFFFMPKKETK